MLKHGRKAKSLGKYWPEEISNTLMRPIYKPERMASSFCHGVNSKSQVSRF